jgi:hypothetical protein
MNWAAPMRSITVLLALMVGSAAHAATIVVRPAADGRLPLVIRVSVRVKSISLRSSTYLRATGQFLGVVTARDEKEAFQAAVLAFQIRPADQKPLLARRR